MTKLDWSRVHKAKIAAPEREKTELSVGGSVSLPGEHEYAIKKLGLKDRGEKVMRRRRKAAEKAAKRALKK